jgi:hypothetical protein
MAPCTIAHERFRFQRFEPKTLQPDDGLPRAFLMLERLVTETRVPLQSHDYWACIKWSTTPPVIPQEERGA